MKKAIFLITALLTLLSGGVKTQAMEQAITPTGSAGRMLTSLWKSYDEAVKADRPQQMAEILQSIKTEAIKKHYAADFFDAGKAYIDACRIRNWKSVGDAQNEFAAEVEAFKDPVVYFAWMEYRGSFSNAYRLRFVKENMSRMKKTRSPYFIADLSLMGRQLSYFIANDYEYALWVLLMRENLQWSQADDNAVYAALKEEIAGRYPAEGYLEFYRCEKMPSSVDVPYYTALAEQYKDKALGFWPRSVLLRRKFDNYKRISGTPEADYKALLTEAQAFERERAALKGDEARIVRGITNGKYIVDELQSTNLSVALVEDTVVVSFRNLPSAEMKLYQVNLFDRKKTQKTILSRTVENPDKRFYVIDNAHVALPALDDGDYQIVVRNGEDEAEVYYTQHSLSIGIRKEKRGYAAYAADYKSGEPVKRADLVLYCGDRVVEQARDFAFDGFTLLPEGFQKQLAKTDKDHYLVCSYKHGDRLRMSGAVEKGWWYDPSDDNDYKETRCNIYRDRGAYNPGDILQFKAVVYRGDFIREVQTVEGMDLEVILYDTQNKEVEKKYLTTNEFGSVSGTFSLPLDRRNGRFSLAVRRKGGSRLDATYFTVDEFVLPTYELSFEREEKLFVPGEEVTVKGRLVSYTGHSLSGAKLEAKVERYGEVVHCDVDKKNDGTFKVRFTPNSSGYCRVTVTVTDETGETQEFGTGVYVADAIRVSLSHNNAASGSYELIDEESFDKGMGLKYRLYTSSRSVLSDPKAVVKVTVSNSNGDRIPLPADYRVLDEKGQVVFKGSAESGEDLTLDFSALGDGVYTLIAEARVALSKERTIETQSSHRFLKVNPDGNALDAPVKNLFLWGESLVETGEGVIARFGRSDGPVWAEVEVFGQYSELLERKAVYLSGVRGKASSLTSLSFPYKAEWPDAVEMQIFYFRDGSYRRETRQYHRQRHTLDLPLRFTSFEDRTRPATEYQFTLQTDPGVEAVVAIFDKAIDAIQTNYWNGVELRPFTVSAPGVRTRCGSIGSVPYWDEPVLMAKAAGGRAMGRAVNDGMVMEEAVVEKAMNYAGPEPEAEQVTVREKFENALAFLPELRSDASGKIDVRFSTSDKLSTYHVQVFAHDRNMRNDVIMRDMLVTIPLKVAVTEPRYLYDGDRYTLAASVASNLEKPVTGTLYCYVYPGAAREGVEPSSVQRKSLTVPAGASAPASFDITVPKGVDAVGLKVVFAAGESSDGVFVSVPVLPAVQTLTEAHSAVLLSGMDRDALIADLQGRFVNVKPSATDFKEITVLDMVRDAIPDKVNPEGKDVLSLSEAYYIRLVAAKLGVKPAPAEGEEMLSDADLLKKILACRNGDGGFGWFEGMTSSRVITAVMLERFARLRDHGYEIPDMTRSVKYLDDKQFGRFVPAWCGGLSTEQYLYVRSMYPQVAWKVTALGDLKIFNKEVAEFKKDVKEYLVPGEKDGRGLNGRILAKARRTKTLQNLSSSKEGIALAKAFGVKWGAASKLEKSLQADILSLSEYAVPHKDGGIYYPNAVMPFRGLLESEAYAHSLLCDLMAANGHNDIADGIRIWLMLQKETQHWDTAPEFVDAISSILDGSEEALSTRVLLYQTTYTKPFREILAAGNGFTIERSFARVGSKVDEDSGVESRTLEAIAPGTVLHRGEKIIAQYRIWNQENRSFVQVVVPREATLRPVNQLSGRMGWWLRPLSVDGWYSFSPQGYRNVKADRTEYYFDSYPEEWTTLTEEFFVQQDGVFSAPVVTVESLYATHYRANGAYAGEMTVKD